MTKFKVGDRVALYTAAVRLVGTVKSLYPLGIAIVYVDGQGSLEAHCKQLRRLKARAPREVWVNEYPFGLNEAHHLTLKDANKSALPGRIACVRFVEKKAINK